jgi:hypothetical protein
LGQEEEAFVAGDLSLIPPINLSYRLKDISDLENVAKPGSHFS